MVGLGLSGSLWAVETPECEMPSFKSLNGDGDDGRETKDEPAEDDIDFVEEGFGEAAWMPLYYEGSDGRIYLNLEKLSDELWMMILEFLDFGDLGRLAQVSPFFLRMIQDPDVLGPREIWPHYAGLSRFPSANDRSVLNQQLLDSFRDWAPRLSLSQEHCLYFLQRILRLGGDVNARDSRGYAPLHWAARNGFESAIRTLVQLGADVNARDPERFLTPLHLAAEAAEFNTESAMRILAELGADVNARDSRGYAPLHWAARNGSESAMRILAELGADVNARNIGGLTPLHDAVAGRHVEVMCALVGLGADMNARDSRGLTLLRIAELNGDMEMLGALRHQVDVPVEGALGLAPVAGDEEADDEGAIEVVLEEFDGNEGGDWTREQLLGALVLVGALTYSTGCNLL